jgi:hypothetical protein
MFRATHLLLPLWLQPSTLYNMSLSYTAEGTRSLGPARGVFTARRVCGQTTGRPGIRCGKQQPKLDSREDWRF